MGTAGGRRYKHPEAGKVIRALFAHLARKPADPRQDVLVNVGLLTGNKEFHSRTIDDVVVERVKITNPEGVMYAVTAPEGLVFEALFIGREVTFGTYRIGKWVRTLATAAKLLEKPARPKRRKKTEVVE